MRVLIEAGADVAQAGEHGLTYLMVASLDGHVECVRALLEARADVAQSTTSGATALMYASSHGHVECVRTLLEAGANVMQLRNTDGTGALECACESLDILQLLCAYAPSREAVRAHPMPVDYAFSPECAQWLEATSRWTSPLHHFEFLPIERVRALLIAGADLSAGDGGADAPTPLSLATARLLLGDQPGAGCAALIASAGAPWSPDTHALFPAGAKARAVELLHIGHVMPHAIERP
jgi:ankyrin repeat protein